MLIEKRFEKIMGALADSEMIFSKLNMVVGGSSSTLENRLETLILGGFVEDTRQEKFPFKRTLFLTNKGREVLDLLEEGKV